MPFVAIYFLFYLEWTWDLLLFAGIWNLLLFLASVHFSIRSCRRNLEKIRMEMGQSVLTYPERTESVSNTGYQDLGFIRKSRFSVTQCLLPLSFTIWPCIWSLSTLMPLAEADQAQLCVTSETLQDCTLDSKYQFSPVSWVQSALNMGIQVQRAIGSYFPFKWNCKRLQVQDMSRVSCCIQEPVWEIDMRGIYKQDLLTNPLSLLILGNERCLDFYSSIIHPSSILSSIIGDCRHDFSLAIFNPYRNLSCMY